MKGNLAREVVEKLVVTQVAGAMHIVSKILKIILAVYIERYTNVHTLSIHSYDFNSKKIIPRKETIICIGLFMETSGIQQQNPLLCPEWSLPLPPLQACSGTFSSWNPLIPSHLLLVGNLSPLEGRFLRAGISLLYPSAQARIWHTVNTQ